MGDIVDDAYKCESAEVMCESMGPGRIVAKGPQRC